MYYSQDVIDAKFQLPALFFVGKLKSKKHNGYYEFNNNLKN